MLTYLKHGNLKLPASVARFDLPTSVCKYKCHRCYARKRLYPTTVQYRQRCLDLAESDAFIETINAEIYLSGTRLVRIHTAGDFYSQDYIDKWVEVIRSNPHAVFFGWTKRMEDFDFSKLPSNANIINSMTPLGYNYGSREYVDKLVALGYYECPDHSQHTVCMRSCQACLTEKKVCFIVH